MNNARFWTGLVFLGGLPMGLAVGTAPGSAWCESTLEGQVRYNGHPVTHGVLFFYSQQRERSDDMVATIGPGGRFSCSTYLAQDDGERVPFRVHITPDPRHCKADVKPATQPPASVAPWPVDPGSWAAAGECFQITLGPEPTRLEIDLTD